MFKFNNIHLDDNTMWPKAPKIGLEESYEDDRGYIQPLVNFPMKNLSMIFSNKGAVRSNHSHHTDWHYMYTIKGSFDYYYKPHGSNEELKLEKFTAGEMVFTPPMEDHACVFLEDTLLVVVSRNPRDQETYESDTVRIQLIDPSSVNIGE
jgi:quercetin dioxygenase-like cupin family protein